ncbi:MAG TPA: hypothetical protein VHX16_03645 [Chloroflexota bacterium]|nr:hypothetical protein [Chloroflexota bacterium]
MTTSFAQGIALETSHADARADALWAAYRASNTGMLNYRPPRCPSDGSVQRVTSWRVDDVPSIDAMRDSATRTWQRMEVQFDGFVSPVSSFRPGAAYPEVYIRDVSTMLPALQYFYGPKFLEAGLSDFLGSQYDQEAGDPEDRLWGALSPGPGAITGIIRANAPSKVAVVSDEEISLVRAASVYYGAAGGTEWLKQSSRGKTVLQRLNAAMDWIWANRTDPGTGLVKRRHTTDWGDIPMEGGTAEGSIPADANVWTASIYDQAIAYQGLRELAAMNRADGDAEAGDILDTRADDLKVATQTTLWQPGRGFFRTHLHLTPFTHSFDEDAIVSIANAHALYSGIAEGLPEQRIVENLERARVLNGVPKPGLSLSQPYLSGLFGHPNMGAWSYQNGGVWDWWGGLQVSAEFQQGYSVMAFQHLQEIADDWQLRGGDVWEWQNAQTRSNSGSSDYAGAAATASEAVISGLFGVRMEPDVLWLGPRLGEHSGAAQVVQPSSGCWVAMTHTARDQEIAIAYESNKSGEMRLSALIPEASEASSVLVNGRPTDFVPVMRGQDSLIVMTGLAAARGEVRIGLRPRPTPQAVSGESAPPATQD